MKLRGLDGVYTRHLKDLEMEHEKELVEFVTGSQEHVVTLSGLKKSYLSDVEKIQAQNDKISALLKGQELQNLKQESNYYRTFAKIDFYLNKVPTVACSLEKLKYFIIYTKSKKTK